MKRFNCRIIIGAALILGGVLMLLDKLNILTGAADYFWDGLLGIAAVIFLYLFVSDRRKWWAAIPAFTLAGMTAAAFLPDRLGWSGLAFLGGIGAGFWAVYLRDTRQWWAIIPGGILLTLGITSAMSEAFAIAETGGVFFVGLGITFLLVGLLARMKWAYIPAAILLALGFFLGTPFEGVLEYVWIGILLLGGLALIIDSFRE